MCEPPPTDGLNGWYEPVQDRYTHKQSITYNCNNPFGIQSDYNTITCIRGLHPNGTVYGKWNMEFPICEVRQILIYNKT